MGPQGAAQPDCPLCRRYGPDDHEHHRAVGRFCGPKRKHCKVCGVTLRNIVRSPYCEKHLALKKKEQNRLNQQRFRDRKKREKAVRILTENTESIAERERRRFG